MRILSRLGGALLLSLCTVPVLGAAPAQRPNLLLLTVDTLRADHLGSYGHPGGLTPNIDRLAGRGVLFTDTTTVIGKTGPAFATVFTSLYPPSHGARRNGVRMRDDVPTLGSILKQHGYGTAAFVSNWTLKDHLSGLARGFDRYDEEFNRVRNALGARERDAQHVTWSAVAWLKERETDDPLFLWVHYSEPHTPYDLQEEHAPEPPPDSQRDSGWNKRWRYASEVAFTDEWIGRLHDLVEELLPGEPTYVVFLSDHGESLGEHDYWGHGKNTHWPNLAIPWIIHGPGVPVGRRIAQPASLVDVLPTVLELLGIEPPQEPEGQSLVASWRESGPAGTDQRLRFALGERSTALTKKGRSRYNHPLAISAQTPDMKAIYDFSERALRYYDLRRDAAELEPLAKPPIATRPPLGRRLANWYKDLPKFEQKNGELGPEDIENLRSLGYLE